MYCPSCGEELAADSAFCTNCGEQIEASEEPTEAGQQAETTREQAAHQAGSPPAGGGAASTQGSATAAKGEVAGGLEENVAGTLAYVLGFVTGLIFLLIEEDNDFVRFHAAQSIVVFGGLFVLGSVLSLLQGILTLGGIRFVGWMLAAVLGFSSMLVSLAALVLWIVLMVKAYNGERYALPVAGGMAESLAS